MEQVGIRVEKQHHEVATAGQAEIDMRFAPLVKMGDNLMWYKYIVKNVARKHGKTATFMPKPIFGDNGSGMHVHQSIWKGEKPLFAGNGYGGMSEMAMHYIGGILKHAPALAAFTNPTTNSYRRLVPGFEAPVNLAYSSRNRSAAVRIPMYSPSPKAKRIEVRFPDPTCNGYLAFAAMLMAGLDGIENRLAAGDPLDKDIYSLTPEELKDVPGMPASLEKALANLKKDHEFLLKGDVFTEDVIDTWIDYKMENEVSAAAPASASVRVLPVLRRLIGSSYPQKRPAAHERCRPFFVGGSDEGGGNGFQHGDTEARSPEGDDSKSPLLPISVPPCLRVEKPLPPTWRKVHASFPTNAVRKAALNARSLRRSTASSTCTRRRGSWR